MKEKTVVFWIRFRRRASFIENERTNNFIPYLTRKSDWGSIYTFSDSFTAGYHVAFNNTIRSNYLDSTRNGPAKTVWHGHFLLHRVSEDTFILPLARDCLWWKAPQWWRHRPGRSWCFNRTGSVRYTGVGGHATFQKVTVTSFMNNQLFYSASHRQDGLYTNNEVNGHDTPKERVIRLVIRQSAMGRTRVLRSPAIRIYWWGGYSNGSGALRNNNLNEHLIHGNAHDGKCPHEEV